jgi:hypothetical protein
MAGNAPTPTNLNVGQATPQQQMTAQPQITAEGLMSMVEQL